MFFSCLWHIICPFFPKVQLKFINCLFFVKKYFNILKNDSLCIYQNGYPMAKCHAKPSLNGERLKYPLCFVL